MARSRWIVISRPFSWSRFRSKTSQVDSATRVLRATSTRCKVWLSGDPQDCGAAVVADDRRDEDALADRGMRSRAHSAQGPARWPMDLSGSPRQTKKPRSLPVADTSSLSAFCRISWLVARSDSSTMAIWIKSAFFERWDSLTSCHSTTMPKGSPPSAARGSLRLSKSRSRPEGPFRYIRSGPMGCPLARIPRSSARILVASAGPKSSASDMPMSSSCVVPKARSILGVAAEVIPIKVLESDRAVHRVEDRAELAGPLDPGELLFDAVAHIDGRTDYPRRPARSIPRGDDAPVEDPDPASVSMPNPHPCLISQTLAGEVDLERLVGLSPIVGMAEIPPAIKRKRPLRAQVVAGDLGPTTVEADAAFRDGPVPEPSTGCLKCPLEFVLQVCLGAFGSLAITGCRGKWDYASTIRQGRSRMLASKSVPSLRRCFVSNWPCPV